MTWFVSRTCDRPRSSTGKPTCWVGLGSGVGSGVAVASGARLGRGLFGSGVAVDVGDALAVGGDSTGPGVSRLPQAYVFEVDDTTKTESRMRTPAIVKASNRMPPKRSRKLRCVWVTRRLRRPARGVPDGLVEVEDWAASVARRSRSRRVGFATVLDGPS